LRLALGIAVHAEPAHAPDAGRLFEQYRARIQRYVRGMVRDRAEAEDLTQETFLRAHRQLASLRDPAAVVTWLYRIATHVCYDRFRRMPTHPPQASAGEERWAEEPAAPRLEKLLEQAEMSACVQGFIQALPDAYRRVLLLHDVHGLTASEIAGLCRSSVEAVKIRLHRARRRLEAALAGGCSFARDERDVLVCEPTSERRRSPARDQRPIAVRPRQR
jgi:RNA polymerase sigma-70 factor (ECF subfamily)